MDSIYESYKLNEAGQMATEHTKLVLTYCKKVGLKCKVEDKIGYNKIILVPQGTYIVADGVGLSVKSAKGKEIKYFDRPKMNYKKAVQTVGALKEDIKE